MYFYYFIFKKYYENKIINYFYENFLIIIFKIINGYNGSNKFNLLGVSLISKNLEDRVVSFDNRNQRSITMNDSLTISIIVEPLIDLQ